MIDNDNFLEILKFPNPELLRVSEPVTSFNEGLYNLEQMIFATMIANHGIGLAAPQVNIFQRFFVVKLFPRSEELVFINPEITQVSENVVGMEEGCLSFPGESILIERPISIHARFQNNNGKWKEQIMGGMLAKVYQHELDHLNGKLIRGVNGISCRDRS